MFPLQLVAASQGLEIQVDVKSGETFNGILDGVDKYMNLKLLNPVETSADGTKFHRMKEIIIKGFNVKYIRLEEQLLSKEPEGGYNVPKWFGKDDKKKKGGLLFTSLEPKKK